MSKTRRLQILLEPEQYSRIERAAAASGGSVASVIRAAIDRHLPAVTLDADQALEAFLAAPGIDVEDWDVMKVRFEDELADRS